MGRIRTLKPEILEDDKTANLSHLEWRLFVSVILLADDHGNLRGEASYVQGATLWASRESRESVAKALETLARVSLLGFYRVRGQLYLHIVGWEKHQRVDKPGKPRMPLPSDPEAEWIRPDAEPSRDPRETLANDSRDSRETLATDLRPPTSDHDPDHEGDPERDPRARARAIPPSPVLVPTPDPARALLVDEIWASLEAARARAARARGWDPPNPLPAFDTGRRELLGRLIQSGDIERGKRDALHIIAVGEAEAIAKGTLEFLSGRIFKETSWSTKCGMRIEDAQRAPPARLAVDARRNPGAIALAEVERLELEEKRRSVQ
jgi:hypothetical protein